MWLDEAISFFAVKNYSFWEIITKFAPGDVHPPLYYLLLKLWTGVFGYSEIALRLPSVLAGVLAVFVVYKIGQKLFNEKIGKLAALFLAINPLAVYYSQEARMYSLATLLVALSVWAFLSKKKSLFGIFFGAALYTDYIPWLMVPVWGMWGIWGIWPLLLVIPWAVIFWQQLSASAALAKEMPFWGQVVGGLDAKAILLVPVKFIFGRIPTSIIMTPIIAGYFWVITKTKTKIFWLWLLVPLVLGLLISLKIPIFTYHRFLFVLPALMLLLAAGADKRKWAKLLVILVSLGSLGIFNLNPSWQRENWRGATAYINSDPGKVLMPSFAQDPALRYYGAKMNQKDNPVYLIRYVQEIFDPQDSKRILLENAGYKKIEQKSFNGVVIWKYTL